jgi:2-phosphosulfolactate phosphatase
MDPEVMNKPNLEVCFTPTLLQHHDVAGKNVVIIDVFRATSTITTALFYGVKKVVPVSTLEECKSFENKGFLLAAERNGLKPDGFRLGNSPYDYMSKNVNEKTLVLTTTNGTRAVEMSIGASNILCGAFLNLSALTKWLISQKEDCLLFCAGWKGRFSMEDTLCAGAIVSCLKPTHDIADDEGLAASLLYDNTKSDLLGFLKKSSHYNRLSGHGIIKDIELCLAVDKFGVVPILRNGGFEV